MNFIEPQCSGIASLSIAGNLWHRRFGHLNFNDLKILNDNNVVHELVCNKTINKNIKYDVCCEGKQPRLSFKNEGKRSNSLLHIVHADLCGPMGVPSIGGCRYQLLFEYDYSKMVFEYFLKNNDEVFFLNHLRFFKILFKIKRIQI